MTRPGAVPPHDIGIEQAVLGSMMLSRDALAGCLEVLRPGSEVFFRAAHQLAFEAIVRLDARDAPVDVLTVSAELEHSKTLAKAGDLDYLHTLLASVSVAASGPAYAQELLDLHMRRELRSASQTIAQVADDPGDRTRAEMADAAYGVLDRLSGHITEPSAVPVSSLVVPMLDALEAGRGTVQGLLTGWRDLDRAISGFRPGQLVVVGGRPGMGKSVVLLSVAAYASVTMGQPGLVCSLEMSRDECMERLLSSFAEVPYSCIRDCVLTSHDWEKIAKAQAQLSEADTLLIEDSPDVSLHDIRAGLRSMARAGTPARFLVVDYLQLMGSQGKGRQENRQLEVSEMSRGLKKLAKEFAIPVLVGSQVNRGPEMRSDKRPMSADLRESGSLENDADVVILLYRDDVYHEESARAGEIDLIIAKNRQGPQSTVPLAFRGHFVTCADLYRGTP